MKIPKLIAIVQKLYRLVDELEEIFPGRKFTLDGHLVGSLGECFAAEKYGVELLPNSTKTHDAKKGSWEIQIKTTQKKSIAISSEPKFLLVLKLERNGNFSEIYNGGGARIWNSIPQARKENPPRNGQFSISFKQLEYFKNEVPPAEKISK